MNIYEERNQKIKVSRAKFHYLCELKGFTNKDMAERCRVSPTHLGLCIKKGGLPKWLADEAVRVLGCTYQDFLD